MMTWLDWTLASIIVALIVCPPNWDPAIRWKEWLERRREDRLPECFGQVLVLQPQDRAENGCDDCPHRGGCLEMSKAQYPRHDALPGWSGDIRPDWCDCDNLPSDGRRIHGHHPTCRALLE